MRPGSAAVWLATTLWLVSAEHVRDLEVSEGAPQGTRVGFIGDGSSSDSGPPYLIVPVPGSAVDTDLSIEQNTGEIRTKVALDRETRASYSLVAIPLSGENVRVVVRVLDENDNAPNFPSALMSIEFPENTPRDVKRTLNPARDLDLGIYNTQRYNIVSGNVNNAFRLSSHRERDGVLYLDLQINGCLDRETTDSYNLMIEALDGGSPPLKGQMTVNITIQDVNDNQPIFNQSRYFATVPENATVGTSILQVHATDADTGENGEIEYSINRRQSDREGMFKIDSKTGLIAVNRPLDFETKEVHELVVVAKDLGGQPLETTAFVSIRVSDVNDNQPTINVIFLSDDATPKISEMAQPGEFVARISVNDPDSKTEYSNVNVTLEGGEGHFGLATQDNIIYLVIVSLPIDREQRPNYTLSVIATDTGTPPLHASRTFHLRVTDINDNAPRFEESVYYANVLEVADPGTSVFQVNAVDIDEGDNSMLTYTIQESAETHSSWFQIDSRSGLISTKSHIDCETDPVPQLTVIATDSGTPPLSSTATVLVTIHDVNDNEPIFEQSFYNVTLTENETKGRCVLKVSATDPDCGVNAMVNYTLAEGYGRQTQFEVKSVSGEVCISGDLDFETRSYYEFPVIATDRGGLSTTATVKVQVTDVNDNWPTFFPREYNVSLRPGTSTTGAVLAVVQASDRDSGRLGTVTYQITGGNEGNLFRIDRLTGEIFLNQPSLPGRAYRLNVSATDGGGLRSREEAEVVVTVSDVAPAFEKTRYSFDVREDVPRNTAVGAVKAVAEGYRSSVRYSIVAGDAEGYFTIDSSSGVIRTASMLDHETRSSVLLTIRAFTDSPAAQGYTQAKITVEDVNDNSPEFDSSTVRLSVPENAELGVPLYAAHARDSDAGRNGLVRYRLVSASSGDARLFALEPRTGHLTLARRLDYETAQRHSLVVSALDSGEPPLSANLTVLIEVQDVNDNLPVFERTEYAVTVSESLALNSPIVQVTAVDLDTGNNARLTYRLMDPDDQDVFGILPTSGRLFLRRALDRETRDRFALRVAASDNGTPAGTATALVAVTVSDANDNDPVFSREAYQFAVEENLPRGAPVGIVAATDRDLGANGALRYSLIPSNSSFQINPLSGEVFTREPLDREVRSEYELVAEARDQGNPPRSARVSVKVTVSDVNDNAPDLVDPQEDVISVREEQPPGTEVVRVRAVDRDQGHNASVTYSIVKGKDTDGYGVFTVDQMTGLIRTKAVLDHEERAIYRIAVAASDGGSPPLQTVRVLRVEVLDLNDNRPTFTSSSLVFKIREDVPVGYVVGNVVNSDSADGDNLVAGRAGGGHVMYTLTPLSPPDSDGVFDMDRSTGSLVVARRLDRETHHEYKLEVRALDTSTSNNPQSSAVVVRVELSDANDNPPRWAGDPLTITVAESAPVGSAVWNFSATDDDAGPNGELRYSLLEERPATTEPQFSVDPLTGTLTLLSPLDFETIETFTLVVRVTDQATNVSDRLSSSLTVRVVVQDVNDNSPVFVSPATKTVTIMEDAKVGYSICKITAVDKDSGENERTTYTLSGGNEDGQFTLGYDSGVLALARHLDISGSNGISPSFRLNVTASDHGNPPRRTAQVLNLVVQGSSDSPPRFIHATYQANIPEDAAVGSTVIKVTAGAGSQPAGGRSGNLSFHLARGVADEKFSVDTERGTVTLISALDRETRDHYVIPVYVMDKLFYDVATVSIRVTDVNDHAPEFRHGACYPLTVPENSDLAVVHTLTATDADAGANSEVTYSISGGNIGNKFSIDLHSGELSARPLDRETQSRYQLVITAQDRGSPPLSGTCNITVTVDDQNDNDPRFSKLRYTATIPEDTEAGSAVLTVKASDADLGVNAKLVYSLANESQWLFHIDNRTGVITTAGEFDRERQSVYEFQVVATDGGRYDARSQSVPVQITIGDVNDNEPQFALYPFYAEVPAYTQPGHEILHVTAVDNDEGTNADIVFSLVNEPPANRFRINPNSGSVTAASSLAGESGKLFHLEVLATDKGNPPRSATGLIEIKVGESSENAQLLRFQNSTYDVLLPENSPVGKEIIQVSAVRSDGRRQRISYSIGSGNDNGAFEITSSGVIRVRDSRSIDYETNSQMKLVVIAQADGPSGPPLYGYAQVFINLVDQNDNTPRFTQQQYSAVVWEGNNKGTFVMQVSATDMDQGANARLLYHIVDGNHDNAFVIEPPFSGLVKTNIVLDREIRDMYRLIVIATDEGVPQLTGTSTIRINIVDVNDNQPTFPPHSIISISEGKVVGSVVTTVSANDVDTNPALTYRLQEDPQADGVFSIDRFSGKVILRRPLDFETRQEYRLRITVSDTAHTASTELTVKVTDDNDNAPVFSQASYKANLLDSPEVGHAIVTVNATDLDTGANGEVRYSLLTPVRGFTVDERTGAVLVNRSAIVLSNSWDPVLDLVVVATDGGRSPLSATAAVRVHVNNAGGGGIFGHDEFRLTVNEKAEKGTSLLKMGNTGISERVANPQYTIISGDSDNAFQILSPQGELILLKTLDRETKDMYLLRVTSSPLADNSSAIQIHITVEDANDNPPKFVNVETTVYVSEGVSIGHSVLQLTANDADLPPNSDVRYDITSGNDEDLFEVDLVNGILTVKNELDFDVGPSEYSLVVRATDNAKYPPDTPLSTVETIRIILEDENDNSPHFPVTEYLEFVGENEAIGTPVFTARATDIDRGAYGHLNYSIMSAAASGFTNIEDSWKLFRVDPTSGLVTTNAVFDYEARNHYAFTLTAGDIGGRTARVRVRVEIESRDEFHPQFTERTYRFVIGVNDLPVGYVVGHVTATDRDKGPDGRVVYQLSSQHSYFKINRTTGVIMVKRKFDAGFDFKQGVSLVVTASSGRQGSLTNMSVVEIAIDPLADTESNIVLNGNGNEAPLAATGGGIADWAMGLLIALILIVLAFGAVFLFLHIRNRRHKKVNKPGLSGGQSTDSFVDPSAFDTIPIRGGVAGPASQFGPPKYDEIPTYRNNNTNSSNSGAATTSELSGSEQSGSSGRGSAEDGEDVEDEEIRMINEGPLQRESGLHRNPDEEDNISDVSVHNTQEYLARLGIVDTQGTSSASRRHSESLVAGSSKDGLLHHQAMDGLHMFDEDAAGENDITNIIYAKLNDVSGSERGSSTEDVGGGSAGALGAAVDHVMVMGGFSDVQGGTHQPSMNGSLSSIVHSEEELTGSYNWDYLLDWGPQYQPLAHVFSEIARLKDDAASVKSGNSGASSGKSKNCAPPVVKTVPPPLLTSVAPRSIAAPVLSARGPHHPPSQMLLLPRSPISHDASGAGFSTSAAMSPSFSPSLSPLATRSPSISPLVTPGVPTSHHVRQRTTDSELRI